MLSNMFKIKVSPLKINTNIREKMNYVKKDGPQYSRSEDIPMYPPIKLTNSNLPLINNPFQSLLMLVTGNTISPEFSQTVKTT